jgi:hypothetical protein
MDGGQIAEDFEQLVRLFAEADHDAGLGDPFGPQLFGVAQQLKGALVARAGADHAIEARHGLSVVVEDFGRASTTMRMASGCPESRG